MKIGRLLTKLFLVLFIIHIIGGNALSDEVLKSQITVKNAAELSIALKKMQAEENSATSTIIYVKPGNYTVSDTILINVSNITVIAEPDRVNSLV